MPDRWQAGKVTYPLDQILLLCPLAVLAGAEAFTDIARFGEKKFDLLRRLRPRPSQEFLPSLRVEFLRVRRSPYRDGTRMIIWAIFSPRSTRTLKTRTALLRALKDVFRRYRSQSIERVISLINPMLRGWVNYFAVGHSGECFSYIKDWVEKKVRRHMAHARKRKGFGWERWSRPWLYDTLKLFNSYRVRRDGPKAALA